MDTISVDAAQHIRWDILVAIAIIVIGLFALVGWLVLRTTRSDNGPCMFKDAEVCIVQEPTRAGAPPKIRVQFAKLGDDYVISGADDIRRSANKLREIANEMDCAADNVTRYSYFAWLSGG